MDNNFSHSVESFLKSVYSNIDDNVTAWDKAGVTGWNYDHDKSNNNNKINDDENTQSVIDCNTVSIKNKQGFLSTTDTNHHHATDASNKLAKYYTPDLEKFVEKQYYQDYHNVYYQFSR